MDMNYEIVELSEKTVAGLAVNTSNLDNKAVTDIGSLWGKFFTGGYPERIPHRSNNKTIGLYTDYEGDFTKPYNFLACCPVDNGENVPDGLTVKTIPGGKYAKFIINGHVQKVVGEFWARLWNLELDRKYSSDFEEYQNNSGDPENQEIHVYIALN